MGSYEELRDYDRRTQECAEAKGGRDGCPQPHPWPASGPNARKWWNPTPPPPPPTAWGEGDT